MKKTNILKSFGLDRKSEMTYRALLALADAPASAIAQRAGLKRTSVYHILENLISMGLASSYAEKGNRRFVAEHPSNLKVFFERQSILAERLIPDLEKEITKTKNGSAVRIFEGKNAVRTMSEESLAAKDKMILSIGSSKKLLELLGGKYGYGKRRRERKIFSHDLRFPEDGARGLISSFHEVRILPDSFNFPGFIFIFDQTVAIIPFEEPVRGILIADHDHAQMMRSLFEVLWNSKAGKLIRR